MNYLTLSLQKSWGWYIDEFTEKEFIITTNLTFEEILENFQVY